MLINLRLARLAAATTILAGMSAPSISADQEHLPVVEGFATTADGIRLYYRVAGSGPETVIAPFALYHGNTLDPLARGRRIVTYDPRGRGKSEAAPLDRVSLDYLLADLETVRSAVGAEKVAIIGWSGAGMETFVYTLRNPDRVTRLVQLAPVAARFVPYGGQMMADRQARTNPAAKATYDARVKAGEFSGKPAEQCRASNDVSNPALLADPADAKLLPDVCGSPNEHPATIGSYFGALFSSIDGYDWRDSLDKVSIPRLVIHPLQDNIPLAGNEEWVRGKASARILTIDRSGHFPAYEQPEKTLSAIDTFLAGNWPAEAKALP